MKHGKEAFNNEESRPVDLEASKWAVKQSLGFSPQEQDEFFEWLAADPEHSEAFSRRRQVLDELNRLAEWRPEHSLKPNPDLLQASEPQRKSIPLFKVGLVATSLAAVLILGLFLWIGTSERSASRSYSLSPGAFAQSYERHTLEDGSAVELNRGAQAWVEFSKSERRVNLESGEAHFTITRDNSRPFTVYAQGVAVQAIGTIFNVQIKEDAVNVLVTEGRVLVDRANPPSEDEVLEWQPFSSPRELSAGQQSIIELDVEDGDPLVQSVSQGEIVRQLSWLKQVISFQAAPLSEIVLELNRRNFTQIVIEDPELMDLKLTLALKPHNIDAFIELLKVTNNIQARYLGESAIILHKTP